MILLFGGEIVLDVEGLADLLRRLALDHVGDGLATNVQQGLDIEVVGGLFEGGNCLADDQFATFLVE